jgi:hypothetical protein
MLDEKFSAAGDGQGLASLDTIRDVRANVSA